MISIRKIETDFTIIKTLPKLGEPPTLLWHDAFYDGPINGICLYNNKEHWFEMVEELPYEGKDKETYLGRIFAIVELVNNQFVVIKQAHDMFVKYVGSHTDYINNKRTSKIELKENWNKYYSWAQKNYKHPNIDDNNVVAWWSEGHVNFDSVLRSKLC